MSLNVDKSAYTQLFTNYSPAVDNLYTVEIFSKTNGTGDKTTALNDYLKYHAVSFSFEDERLSLERHPVTKNFKVTSDPYTWANTFTLTWREQDDWLVRKFHENWLGLFYDKSRGVFKKVSNPDILYKDFHILFPVSKTDGKSLRLKLIDVLPANIGAISMQWGTTGNVITRQLTYYVKEWAWEE